MIGITTSAALWAGVLFFAGGLALCGLIKKSILDGLLSTVGALKAQAELHKEQIAALEVENKAIKAEQAQLRTQGEMTSRQLAVSLRVIEYFERVLTVVIKGRPKMPGELVTQIDRAMGELARFREQASLDLESMAVNREHYDWLLAREAIMGPARDKEQGDTP